MANPAPLDEDVVLSPEWLTETLQPAFPGVQVSGTQVTQRLKTVATKTRFAVSYDGDPHGAPPALCVKGYFGDGSDARGGAPESVFYRDFAGTLAVQTPPCHHAQIDEATGHGIVLMTDLVDAGCTFLDPLVEYAPDQVASTLDQLAKLHASTWAARAGTSPMLTAFPGRVEALAGIMPTEVLQPLLEDGRITGVPDDILRADRILAAMGALSALERDAQCIVHGDVHTGNIYLTPDGDVGIIDWQVVQAGLWAIDVGYHVGAVLQPGVRAASERDLVRHYVERLAANGGPSLDHEDAWWLYRAHLAYGYFMWGITRRVVRPVIEVLTNRLAHAVSDHDSFGLLGV